MTSILFISPISGLVVGIMSRLWSDKLIRARSIVPANVPVISTVKIVSRSPGVSWLIWLSLSISASVANALVASDWVDWLIISGYTFILLALARTDWLIRKIPNPTLLALILLRCGHLLINRDLDLVAQSLAGLIIGYFFFQLPTLTGRTIGMGDVKLAAVTGFCTGWKGMLFSVALMGVTISLYLLLLILTGRGNLKTKVAIGSFLAFGMLFSVLIKRLF